MWHHSIKYSEIKPYLQKGVTECKTTRTARRVRLFDPSCESDFSQETIFGWKQMLLLLRGVLVGPCRMLCFHTFPLLYCTAGNVWSVIFSTFDNIPMHSLLADQQTTPCSALFKLPLDVSQPPIHANPLQLHSCSERDPTQNSEDQMVVVFWWTFKCCMHSNEQKQHTFLLFC